jgi:hypothetical protein
MPARIGGELRDEAADLRLALATATHEMTKARQRAFEFALENNRWRFLISSLIAHPMWHTVHPEIREPVEACIKALEAK